MPAKKGPPQSEVREQKIDDMGRSYGSGGRKQAGSRVWIKPGNGTIVVNGQPHHEYFKRLQHRSELIQPFVKTQTLSKFDVWCTVKGGGLSGASCVRMHVLCMHYTHARACAYVHVDSISAQRTDI